MNGLNTKRSIAIIIVAAIFALSIGASSTQNVKAQMNNGNMTGTGTSTNNSTQTSQSTMTMGPNITGSIAMGPIMAKAIASQVHISLANASIIAEKAVGANAHATAVRIGVVHGFLVYMALVVDSNNNFHGVLIDPVNGRVLASTPMSFAALMSSEMGMMMGMMGHGMGMMAHHGMMQHGIMKKPWTTKAPGMMMRSP